MRASGHTLGQAFDAAFHPLGRVETSVRPDGTRVRSTILDLTVRVEGPSPTHGDAAALTLAVGCDRIVEVLNVRRNDQGEICFDTAHVGGVPVASLVAAGAMTPEIAGSILIQTAHALSVAHEFGLVHGALCLYNVLVEPDRGADAIARITDFGVGLLSWQSHERNPEAIPMSPERVMGLDRSPSEDVYLFGSVAYALLYGRPLFGTGTVEEMRRRHAIEDAPRPSSRGEGGHVPHALRQLVSRCLAKEPEDRPGDGGALLEVLRKALSAGGLVTPYDDIGSKGTRGTTPSSSSTLQRAPVCPPSRPRLEAPSRPESAPRPAMRPLPGPPLAEPSAAPARMPPPPPSRVSAPSWGPLARPTILDTPTRLSLPSDRSRVPRPRRRSRAGWIMVTMFAGLAGVPLAFQFAETELLLPPIAVAGGPVPADEAVAPPPSGLPHAPQTPSTADATAVVENAALVEDAHGSGASDAVDLELEDDFGKLEDPDVADAPRGPPAEDASGRSRSQGEPATPDKPNIDRLLAQAGNARANGDEAGAKQRFEEVLDHRPRNVAALEGLSILAFNRGDHRAAVDVLTRAVNVAPRRAELRIRLGDALFKLDEHGKARAQFAKAAELGHPAAARRLARVDAALAGT